MGQHSSVGMRLSNMCKSHILARLYPKAPSQEDQTEEAKGIQQGSRSLLMEHLLKQFIWL